MKCNHFLLAVGIASALLTLPSRLTAQPVVRDGILTDEAGMSLYVSDNEIAYSGKSFCEGACTLSWPPYLAKADAKADGDYGFLVREDGTKQWTYKGRPLYRWFNDKKAGDREGDGFRGVRHLARP